MNLNLSRPATYQITVPGNFVERWGDWIDNLIITEEHDEEDMPITIFTGSMDQAALQGFLRRLYNLGLPLVSVICLDVR
jgi:hypothetical protein